MVALTPKSRWHGRNTFLATTLLAISALGGPLLVTRGLIEHGAMFLPALLLLLAVIGAPSVRLALASGQLDHRLTGRQALQPLSMLVRLFFAGALLVVGARACAWIVTFSALGPTDGLLAYQTRELTPWSASWSMQGEAFAWGALVIACFIILLIASARGRRLAGTSWLGGWLLWLMVALLMLGLFVGYALPGAGALAAIVARPRLESLATVAFWADAATCALLAIGANAGMLAAAGQGLPTRAAVGREARILTTSVAAILVLAGLAGLVLLCAVCARQGVVPGPEHAAPTVLALEVIPALGHDLFPGWPPEYRPSARQVALGWHYIVALCAGFGAAALLHARRWLPSDATSGQALAGYAAAGAIALGTGLDHARGVENAWLPIAAMLPALLGVLHLTLARRAGMGMRVVSAAFGSERPWLERLNILWAMNLSRPVLIAAIIALALALKPHSFALAGMAIAFAIVWLGSLGNGRVPARAIGTALVLLLAAPLWAAPPGWQKAEKILAEPDARNRRAMARELESARKAEPGPAEDYATFRARLVQSIESPTAETPRDQVRDALCALLLLAPDDAELQRLERLLHQADGVRPVRLLEALSEHAAGRPGPLLELSAEIARQLPAPELKELLETQPGAPSHLWALALASDLQHAYGTAAPLSRELRQHLTARALAGRSLLRPEPSTGAVFMTCLGLVAAALALALALGLAPRRPGA